jgi:acyl carrier protein
MDEIATRLTKCFSLVFPGISSEQISGATQESIATWDSVAHINLLTVVDEEFGINTDIENAEDLTSFPALLKHVRRESAAR